MLCTAKFPFGNKSETFLESEIEVLAERFRRIFVLPSHREEDLRRRANWKPYFTARRMYLDLLSLNILKL